MRFASIDVLRTVSIFLMVLVHFLENLSGVNWAPAGLGAPMFGFLVGVSYRIWLNQQLRKGRPDEDISRSSWKRGVCLIGLGFLFNLFVWLPHDLFNWDVLTLIGVAFLVLTAIRDLPWIVPAIIVVLVYVITPILRLHSGYSEYWVEGYFDPAWSAHDLILGFLVNGYFPIFPWLIFPLMGFMIASHTFCEEWDGSRLKETISLRGSLILGGLLFALGMILRFTREEQQTLFFAKLFGGWTMFPASVEYVTTMLGAVILAFVSAIWWIDQHQGLSRAPKVLAIAQTMSRHSLTLYVLHHVIHVWPLWVIGWLEGGEVTIYWQKAMPWELAIALVIPAMVWMFLFVRRLESTKQPTLESLMRRICD